MNSEKYLPVGSVVLLGGANRRLLIHGVRQRQSEDVNTLWDYLGCPFPEGHMDNRLTFLFDHDQIEQVFFVGLQDAEQQVFAEALLELDGSGTEVPQNDDLGD